MKSMKKRGKSISFRNTIPRNTNTTNFGSGHNNKIEKAVSISRAQRNEPEDSIALEMAQRNEPEDSIALEIARREREERMFFYPRPPSPSPPISGPENFNRLRESFRPESDVIIDRSEEY